MCRYPYTKDGNVDASDDEGRAPFEFKDCRSMLGDDGDSVDDDLQKQLDLKDPEEQDEKEEKHQTIKEQVEQVQHQEIIKESKQEFNMTEFLRSLH